MIPSVTSLRSRLRMRHLQLLQALDEKGSLRAAADMMGMSQPAATKALQELEYLIGAALFVRHPRGLEPTVFGEAVSRYAITVLEDLGALRSELAAVESGDIGQVRIGSIPAAAPGMITRAVLALRASSPRLDISIQVQTSDILVQALNNGQLDVVVGRIPAGWPDEHLDFRYLATEALTVVGRPDHPACAPRAPHLDLIRECGWVLQPSPSPMRGVIEEVFRNWGAFQPRSVIETSSILTTLTLIRESDMIAILPQVVGSYFVNMGAIASIPIQLSTRLPPYGLIRRKNRESTPAMHRVTEAIIAEAEAHGGL